MATHAAGQRLSTPRVLSFATPGLVLGYLLVSVSVFLPPLLASHLGVSLTVIGSAWAIVRLIDTAIDPALGILMDRTTTGLGRYRSWLMLGAPILMAAIYALFEAPNGIGFGYLLGWLLVFYLGVSIMTVAHSSWAAKLATDYDDRSRLFGLIAMISVVGGVLVLAFPLLANPLGWSSAQAVQAMGWFVFGLTPLVVGLVCTWTAEPRLDEGGHVRLRDVKALLAKPDLIRLLLAQLTLTLGPGWMSALYLFFLTQARGFTIGAASLLLLIYMVAGVLGALVTARVAVRFSKHRTLIATAVSFSLGLCSVAIVPKANLLATIPVMAWAGFMGAGFDMMIRAMLADVADEVRLEQARDQISLIYALNSVANKVAAALAIGLTFPLLAYIGFNPTDGAHNTAAAIHGLELAFIVGPIVFVMLGALSVAGWKLGPERHGEIRAQLLVRDGAHREAPIMEILNPEHAVAEAGEPPPQPLAR
jgi:GPH family glycoside/pentoside/hexuronide:cation symporter